MRAWIPSATLTLSVTLTLAASSHALPPNEHGRGFREGANHHLGDDGFIARFGRSFAAADGEALRMRAHLVEVRARLGAAPATRPELADARARTLGYLDDYIAKGITPKNTHLPWRSPVFIDDDGAICAVGYLIERSVGRALSERIAAEHRYEFLEDIAKAMPEVSAWVEATGLSLEELASIQPGYAAPIVETWRPWKLADEKPADGAFERSSDEGKLKGAFRDGKMEGEWTKLDAKDKVVGSGRMTRGAGTWRSSYADGAKMAEGPFVDNVPHGEWRFFHPSGNLAAEGRFDRGLREGHWQFFYDKPERVRIADGSFSRARVTGTWRHFDAEGKFFAVSDEETPLLWQDSFGGYLLHVFAGEDGVHHWVHQGNISGDHHRLDMFFDGSEILYSGFYDGQVFDSTGHRLERIDGAWHSRACDWNKERLRAAGEGNIVRLHGLAFRDRFEDKAVSCGEERPVSASRAKHIEKMLGSTMRVRALSPDFVQKLALAEQLPVLADDEEENARAKAEAESAKDLARILASNMTWYVEWPHIDRRFIGVFQTLPGYAVVQP